MVDLWQKGKRELRGNYRVFKVYEQELSNPVTKRKYSAFLIDSQPWVNIVPLTPDLRVVMVKQYRFGLDSISLEVPGGLVEPGEDPADAAKRELREETGFEGNIIKIGEASPNPALHPFKCHMFLALEVKKMGVQSLEPNEIIDLQFVPLQDIPRLINTGEINHSLVMNAFYYTRLYFSQIKDARCELL
ncbi:MAG: NUDIX hydrolase [Promethearchaeota archaeon CR_4]|nr:MAG: NUDIX hydrolase [Candidatus Lokiarchaeota archaeon CR_4]